MDICGLAPPFSRGGGGFLVDGNLSDFHAVFPIAHVFFDDFGGLLRAVLSAYCFNEVALGVWHHKYQYSFQIHLPSPPKDKRLRFARMNSPIR